MILRREAMDDHQPTLQEERRVMTTAERNRHYRALRLAKGQCWFCTNPPAAGSTHTCEAHLAYQRVQGRQTPGLSTWTPGSRGRRPLWATTPRHEAAS